MVIGLEIDPFTRPSDRRVTDVDTTQTRTDEVVEVKQTNTDPDFSNLQAEATIPSTGKNQLKAPKSDIKSSTNLQKGLSVASAGAGILNAIIEFEQLEARAMMNTALANIQFNEALNIGRQEALKAESAGFALGEEAQLEAAAQGQDVQGGISQSRQLAEETFGVLTAMNIESNAVAQAYGFAREAELIEHELNLAEINRNAQIITSGASAALAFI